jgi:hypothetical protein
MVRVVWEWTPQSACPMAIGALKVLGGLSLASCKEGLHLLAWSQGQRAPGRTRIGRLTWAGFAIGLGKLHLDDQMALGILGRRPAIAGLSLGTDHRLGFPINQEVRQIIADFRLIPIILVNMEIPGDGQEIALRWERPTAMLCGESETGGNVAGAGGVGPARLRIWDSAKRLRPCSCLAPPTRMRSHEIAKSR